MRQRSRHLIQVLAVLVAAVGVVNILSAWLALSAWRRHILLDFLPLGVVHGGRMLAVLTGLALLLLSFSIYRRKRRAWELTCGVTAVAMVAHLAKGLDWEEAVGNLVLLVGLVLLRRHFRARSDRPSAWRALGVLVLSPAVTFVYGVAGFYLLDRHFKTSFDLRGAAVETLQQYFEFLGPAVSPVTHHGKWFIDSLDVVGAASLAYALLLLLRPVVYRQTVDLPDHRRAAGLVARYGRSSLAWFTLLDDKSFFFSPTAEAYISYKTVGNIALALGDPLGPDEAMEPIIEQFERFCLDNDWHPAFYQVLPDHLDLYERREFRRLQIGEEAIIDLRTFTLEGGRGKDLRQAVNKFAKLGYRTPLYEPPLDPEVIHRLKEVSDEWLSFQHGSEKTFSVGRFDPAGLRDTPVMTVEDAHGRVCAFANIIGEYTINEMTIDLMRRRHDAEPGAMDLLFLRLAEHFRDQGADGFNLGLAPLSGVGEAEDASVPERTVKFLYEHFNRFYSFKGLRQYKAKFHPRWEPRYLIYASTALLPKVAVAIVRANSTGGLRAYLRK